MEPTHTVTVLEKVLIIGGLYLAMFLIVAFEVWRHKDKDVVWGIDFKQLKKRRERRELKNHNKQKDKES